MRPANNNSCLIFDFETFINLFFFLLIDFQAPKPSEAQNNFLKGAYTEPKLDNYF